MKIRWKYIVLLLGVLFLMVVTGCGKKEAAPEIRETLSVSEYQDELKKDIAEINSLVEGCDMESIEAVKEMLPELIRLYEKAAALEGPEKLEAPAAEVRRICTESAEILKLCQDILLVDEENVSADDMQKVAELKGKLSGMGALQKQLETALSDVFYIPTIETMPAE